MKTEYHIGQIFQESYPEDTIKWCQDNHARILEIDPTEDAIRQFQIFPIAAPTVDDKKTAVRSVRDKYLNDIEWRVSRYRDQIEINVDTTDTEETYLKILHYMQYLRDYPESSETWYEQNPLDFNSWCELSD